MSDSEVTNEIFILEYTIKKGGIYSRDILILSNEEVNKMKIRSKKNEALDTLIVSFSQKTSISQDLIDYLNVLGVRYTAQNFKITSGLNFHAIGYKNKIFTKEAILVLYLLNNRHSPQLDHKPPPIPTEWEGETKSQQEIFKFEEDGVSPPSCPKIISPPKNEIQKYIPRKTNIRSFIEKNVTFDGDLEKYQPDDISDLLD